MALFGSIGAPGSGRTSGDTIDDDFGPFDIGPRGWNGGWGDQLEFAGEGMR